jgi:hypothetical protein
VTFNDFDTQQVYVYTSPADTLAFSLAATLSGAGDVFNDFPKPAFANGDLIVTWQTYDPEGRMVIARESNAWAVEQIDGDAPGQPCECCPLDVYVSPSGAMNVAFRHNSSNSREHRVARAATSAGPWATAVATDTEGLLTVCPMEGPRLGDSAGTLLLTWARASGDGRTYLATSTDGGATWSDERDVFGVPDTSSPTIATSGTRLAITTELDDDESSLITSSNGGSTFGSAMALTTSSGPLSYPQLDANAEFIAVAGGVGAEVWLYVLP